MSDRDARYNDEPFDIDKVYGEDETIVSDEETYIDPLTVDNTYSDYDLEDSSMGDSASDVAGTAKDKAVEAKDKAAEKATEVKDVAAEKASEAKDVAAEKASEVKDAASEKAGELADTLKAKTENLPSTEDLKVQGGEALDTAKEKLGVAGETAQVKADEGIDKAAVLMSTASDKLLEQGANREGQVGEVATMAAEKLDTASTYLQQRSSQDILNDIETLVREKPLESVLVAAGIGLLLSRVFS